MLVEYKRWVEYHCLFTDVLSFFLLYKPVEAGPFTIFYPLLGVTEECLCVSVFIFLTTQSLSDVKRFVLSLNEMETQVKIKKVPFVCEKTEICE